MTLTDNDLDARLQVARIADPIPPIGAVSLLARETRDHAHRASVRKRFGAGAAITALGIGALTAGPAVADNVRAFLALSGWTSTGSEVVNGSPFIDTGAPDLADYIGTIFPLDLPLAPGQTRASVIISVVNLQTPALKQSISLSRDLERQIRLGWLSEWIDAHALGDQSRMDSAAGTLLDSVTWPAFIQTDGGGVVAHDSAFMKAIAAGDVDAAQAFAQYDNARFWDGVDRTDAIDRILAGVEDGK